MITPTFAEILNSCPDLEHAPEKSSLKMRAHHLPWSITEREGHFIAEFIQRHKLKRGFEVATAFGVSALYAATGLKSNDGLLVTMDIYAEERDGFGYYRRPAALPNTAPDGLDIARRIVSRFGV